MKMTKRILSIVLCLAMIVGIIPMSVFAVDEVVLDAAIFCSDVHGSTSDLSSVLAGVKTSGVDYSSIGFVGDTCLTVANTTSIAQSALSDTDIAVMFSYAASHDTEGGADISTNWNYSGEVKGVSDYYLVYTIRETDMQNASGASTAAPAFTTWYNGLTAAEKALPIFIMSHRPLHDRRDDNAGAATWYTAISAAAETSDIVFFWGHNHTSESSVDTAAYYVAKDGTETFTVYNGDTVVPNFTYMNAGYINANGQNPARKGIATTVQITASSLIFQDYNSSGKYSGTYAHNVTVEREFAATKEAVSIDVTGTTRYTVGGNSLALKVTATYDDGTTAVVTDDCTFTGVNLTKSGKYTLTATYGDLTDTLDVVVAAYGEDESTIISVEVVSTGVTAVEVTNVYGEPDLSDSFEDYVACDIALTDYTTGNKIEYTMRIPADMDTTNLGLYHVATVDGKTVLTPVEFTVVNECIVFTSTLTGTFAYGAITVPDGYELYSIEASNYTKDYFVGDSLDITSPFMVTATYKKVDSDDFIRVISVYEENNNPDGYTVDMDSFDMATAGTYNVKLSYTYENVTRETTFPITVWGKTLTGSDVTVTVGCHGVASMTMTDVSVATNVNAAVGTLLNSGFKAYDIVPVVDDNYTLSGTHTVKMPAPANADVVYYFNETTGALTKMEDATFADGYVTFTTDHFSIYVVGETSEADEETLTLGSDETKTAYVLVSTPTAGNQYIIVSTGTAGPGYALKENTTTGTSVTINAAGNGVSAPYIVTSDETIMWNATSGLRFQSENGGYYVYYSSSNSGGSGPGSGGSSNYTLSFSTSSPSNTWTAGTNALYRNGKSNDYYLRCNGGTWAMGGSNSTYNVYFYEKQTVTVSNATKYEVSAEDIEFIYPTSTSTDSEGNTGAALTYKLLANGEKVSFAGEVWTVAVVSDANGIIDTDNSTNSTLYFTGKTGEARVRIYCTFTVDGTEYKIWDTITVKATAPYYSIQLHKAELTKVDITAFADGVTYYTYNSTTNTYQVAESYVEGTTYYTTPVVQGDEITNPIALKGIEAGDTYSVWAVVKEYTNADPDGDDMGSLGNALTWKVSDESIATIDTTTGVITFTGNNYGTFTVTVSYKGADGKVITDTITISVTDSLYTVPGDGTNDFPEYPNEGAVRFDKTATAVGNFSETGITKVELSMTGVPYTTGNELDVVLVLDISSSMDTTMTGTSVTRLDAMKSATIAFIDGIVKNEDDTFNNNRIAVYTFDGSADNVYNTANTTTYNLSTVNATTYEKLCGTSGTINSITSGSGTSYTAALKAAYDELEAVKTAEGDSYNRKQFVVFLTDGGPTSYTYINSDNETDTATQSTVVDWFAMTDEDSANWTNTVPTEYYSHTMKNNTVHPVTIFSVGFGLSTAPGNNGPDEYRDYDGDENYYVTSTLLKGISSGDDYFYHVADSDGATALETTFSNIAVKILEAATDVVVEDKIGNNFSVNFSLPGYGTDYALGADALDGLSEFYIQVVEYQLDANKERTGNPTVLENFTFYQDGSLKSHTVDGVACSGCSHVTITDGVITKIDGTYFDYERKTEIEDGKTIDAEYLTWTADKLTTTELALQYFAWLDNSSGVPEDQQIAADTYYTNEYATLTYTNFQGNRVQQEMPVPQMTWNGAQVSYVFYLVNEQGQPVNRAGKVVPFAEAVYVTDVFTKEVIWNDLEQLASLDASFLAGELVPDVYELYDNDATYFIHVYENENEVNLNNHFVIGGDVTDSTNRTNANTTIVFNTKAGTRYYTVGTYVADDGDNSSGESGLSYLCKGDGTISGTDFTVDPDANTETFATNVYYTLENGIYKRALHYSEGNTYYKLTAASYTAAEGETQVLYTDMTSTSGGTVINGYVYYVDENGEVYTIVRKNNGIEVEAGFDFSNTTVAFAVVWKPELVEDTIVVDFGLDVVIDVITNDNMAAGVVGVRGDAPSGITINSGIYNASKGTSVDLYIDELKIGTATVENLTSVRFSLDKINGMQFTDPVVFYYEVDVNFYDNTGALQTTSMYSSVTIIPATTVYYEDSFVTFTTYTATGEMEYVQVANDDLVPGVTYYTKNGDTYTEFLYLGTLEDGATCYEKVKKYNAISGITSEEQGGWFADGASANGTQDADRPGESKISEAYDADNNYGYDPAYENYSKYSLGGAAKVHVDSGKYATAEFTFYGTGFDIISLTDTTTGYILVSVYDEEGNKVAYDSVDTYYGMEKDGTLSKNNPEALYQVPVIKISGLPYGKKYTAKITVSYVSAMDHTVGSGYDFYLDAIRIYDPTGNQNDTANGAYVADGEGWPTYFEVRNQIIAKDTFDSLNDEEISGIVFMDGGIEKPTIQDYISYGPNNETYLAKDQAIAFDLNGTYTVPEGMKLAKIQIAVKTVGGTGAVEVYGIKNGVRTDCLNETIATATDMYYDITALEGMTVVIKSTGDAVVSITNAKVTYKPDNDAAVTAASVEETEAPMLFSIRRSTANAALATMSVEEETVPEETVPEETVPEETVPEETVPEETVPEETVPEETVPEETVPEETVPEETVPEETVPEETVPEETIPEETEPEETEPGKDNNSKPGNNGLKKAIIGLIGAILGWLFG